MFLIKTLKRRGKTLSRGFLCIGPNDLLTFVCRLHSMRLWLAHRYSPLRLGPARRHPNRSRDCSSRQVGLDTAAFQHYEPRVREAVHLISAAQDTWPTGEVVQMVSPRQHGLIYDHYRRRQHPHFRPMRSAPSPAGDSSRIQVLGCICPGQIRYFRWRLQCLHGFCAGFVASDHPSRVYYVYKEEGSVSCVVGGRNTVS